MKVKVIKGFKDLELNRVHKAGDVFETNNARALILMDKKLVEKALEKKHKIETASLGKKDVEKKWEEQSSTTPSNGEELED